MEYKAQAGELAMGYSHFCRCYREWKKRAVSPCARSTAQVKSFFGIILLVIFVVWYRREDTLSIHHIDSRRR